MRYRAFLLGLAFLLSRTLYAQQIAIESRSIQSFVFENSHKMNLKQVQLHKLFQTAISEVDAKFIDSSIHISVLPIGPDRFMGIVTGKISNQLPEVVYKDFSIFIDSVKRKSWTFFLSDVQIIRLNTMSSLFFIGGIFKHRGKGYFHIYKFTGSRFEQCFVSDELVYNDSFDCDTYEAGSLRLSNIDINEDGILDLRFLGYILTFCDTGESEQNKKRTRYIARRRVTHDYIYSDVQGHSKWRKVPLPKN